MRQTFCKKPNALHLQHCAHHFTHQQVSQHRSYTAHVLHDDASTNDVAHVANRCRIGNGVGAQRPRLLLVDFLLQNLPLLSLVGRSSRQLLLQFLGDVRGNLT